LRYTSTNIDTWRYFSDDLLVRALHLALAHFLASKYCSKWDTWKVDAAPLARQAEVLIFQL
jgi:hypothetical protein